MDPNETTLDTMRPVPQKWDGPQRPRVAQPRYLAAATVIRNC